MLTLTGLASQRDERRVFEPVSLRVDAGTALEVAGANGAGKSTLLRTLAGLHVQFEGTFEMPAALYQGHRTGLDEYSSALENLRWYTELAGRPASDASLREVLARTGMLAHAHKPVAQLSQGQQRRVCMARWMLQTGIGEAGVWLLDEPVTALDQAAQVLLLEVLAEQCAAGGIVAYATHVPLPLPGKQVLEIQGVAHV